MANGQFIIPGTHENEELRHQVDEAFEEILTVNPELQRSLYGEYVDIQVDLEEMRAFATEATLSKGFFRRAVSALVASPRPLEERLVDAESKIGGELF
ncbi:MAG: hypothetical protein WAQ27_02025 [Candidatus Microsaccharimonas sp.]